MEVNVGNSPAVDDTTDVELVVELELAVEVDVAAAEGSFGAFIIIEGVMNG